MSALIVRFFNSQQAKIISTQYLRDDHILCGDSILIDFLGLAAIRLAAQLESLIFNLVENHCPVISPRKRASMLRSRECSNGDDPKIYVACLSAYNNGILHGMWVDATQEPEEIKDDLDFMLSLSPVAGFSPCEEFAIHHFEGFEGLSLHELESIDRVSALAQAIKEHGKPFALYIDHLGFDDVEEAVTAFQEHYCGCFESSEDYARDFYEQTGQLENIEKAGLNSFYIDWNAIAIDWQYSGDFLFLSESNQEIHVFSNR